MHQLTCDTPPWQGISNCLPHVVLKCPCKFWPIALAICATYIWSLNSGHLGKTTVYAYLLALLLLEECRIGCHVSCKHCSPPCHFATAMRCPSMLQPHRLLTHSLLLRPSFHEEQHCCIALKELPLHWSIAVDSHWRKGGHPVIVVLIQVAVVQVGPLIRIRHLALLGIQVASSALFGWFANSHIIIIVFTSFDSMTGIHLGFSRLQNHLNHVISIVISA